MCIRHDMFCHDIHCGFTQIKVRSDSCCCSNTCLLHHVKDHLWCQFLRRHMIGVQIMRHIHKNLIDGVHMHIFRRNISQINVVNLCTVFHIECHSWLCCHISDGKLRVFLQFVRKTGASLKHSFRQLLRSLLIDLFHTLYDFKKPRSSRNPIYF